MVEILTDSIAGIIFIVALSVLLAIFIYQGWEVTDANGQDLDKRYFCIENPFYRSCDPQLQKDKEEILAIINEICQWNQSMCLYHWDKVK